MTYIIGQLNTIIYLSYHVRYQLMFDKWQSYNANNVDYYYQDSTNFQTIFYCKAIEFHEYQISRVLLFHIHEFYFHDYAKLYMQIIEKFNFSLHLIFTRPLIFVSS